MPMRSRMFFQWKMTFAGLPVFLIFVASILSSDASAGIQECKQNYKERIQTCRALLKQAREQDKDIAQQHRATSGVDIYEGSEHLLNASHEIGAMYDRKAARCEEEKKKCSDRCKDAQDAQEQEEIEKVVEKCEKDTGNTIAQFKAGSEENLEVGSRSKKTGEAATAGDGAQQTAKTDDAVPATDPSKEETPITKPDDKTTPTNTATKEGEDKLRGGGTGEERNTENRNERPSRNGNYGRSGNGGSNPMGGLMGMLPMAAMMAMQAMNQDNQEEQGQQCGNGMTAPPGQACPANVQPNGYASPDGVIQANDIADCTKNYAYRYTECDGTVAAACYKNLTYMMTSPICQQFGARYCATGAYEAPQVYSPYPYPLEVGQVIGNQVVTVPPKQHEVDVEGRGKDTTYCFRTAQINFCAEGINEPCPSCMQLNSLKNAACIENPASCNISSSPTQLQSQLNSCPNGNSEPIRLIAGLIPEGTAPVVNNSGSNPSPNDLTAPILPSSAGRDGVRIASATRATASVRREVASQYDRSMFAAASAPINLRCNSGRLNHCN